MDAKDIEATIAVFKFIFIYLTIGGLISGIAKAKDDESPLYIFAIVFWPVLIVWWFIESAQSWAESMYKKFYETEQGDDDEKPTSDEKSAIVKIQRTYSAMNIAAWIIKYCDNNKILMSNLRLQKILFFCQVMYLSKYNYVLFNDDIVAWSFGPAVKSVYEQFKRFGSCGIIPECNGVEYNYAELDNAAVDCIKYVLLKTQDMSFSELSEASKNFFYKYDLMSYRLYDDRVITVDEIKEGLKNRNLQSINGGELH